MDKKYQAAVEETFYGDFDANKFRQFLLMYHPDFISRGENAAYLSDDDMLQYTYNKLSTILIKLGLLKGPLRDIDGPLII